ncbi:MAG TPA: thioredoxin domain-containing protein [Solirubrobacteraceae bacterium]|nr:thioredoxin domain-containing protein [Solirubrobacteraceae bacterium]
MTFGVLLGAVIVVAIAVAVSSSGGSGSAPSPTSAAAKQQASTVNTLLSGIPQSGVTLGSPTAKVTVTEFGDLECPICAEFAQSSENQLISNDVRSGKVKLVYRSLPTATGNGPNPSIFPTQQAAAYAAGAQGKAWNYIELFYHEQGQENTGYVTPSYLDGLARQVPGLNYSTWLSASQSSTYTSQVSADEQAASSKGFNSTPTIVIQGPKGQAQPIVGDPSSYSQLETVIKSVS